MTRSMQVVFAVTLGLLAASVTWAADAGPAMLADACAPCHGTDGMSPGAIPALSGKSAGYIVQRMLEFKAGAREGTVMNRIAKGYTDAEIAAVAQHFAALGQTCRSRRGRAVGAGRRLRTVPRHGRQESRRHPGAVGQVGRLHHPAHARIQGRRPRGHGDEPHRQRL